MKKVSLFLMLVVILLALALFPGCTFKDPSTIPPPKKIVKAAEVPPPQSPPSGEDRFLLLKLKESHISLDLGKHLKNEFNAVEFIMPVPKAYYDEVSIGQNILSGKGFRGASLVFSGSISDYSITVIDKQDYISKFKK